MEDENKQNHCSHCVWVDEEIERGKKRRETWDKVFLAVVISLSVGAVGSFFGFVFWALRVFVERGGK